jgi:hypothetical protein
MDATQDKGATAKKRNRKNKSRNKFKQGQQSKGPNLKDAGRQQEAKIPAPPVIAGGISKAKIKKQIRKRRLQAEHGADEQGGPSARGQHASQQQQQQPQPQPAPALFTKKGKAIGTKGEGMATLGLLHS